MKSFKDQLEESVIPKDQYKVAFHQGFTIPHLKHEAEVNGHHVEVEFSHKVDYDDPHLRPQKGSHNINVYVNRVMDRGMAHVDNPSDKVAITHHVKKVVSNFVKHFNPISLHGIGSDSNPNIASKKAASYGSIMGKLSKRLGGRVNSDEDGADWHLREAYGEILPKEQFQVGQVGHVTHVANVNGHKVDVTFGMDHPSRGEYSIAYNVNRRKDAAETGVKSDKDRMAIGKHVTSVVKSFVHHFNPRALHAYGVDIDYNKEKSKEKNYAKGFKTFKKQYGGRVFDSPPGVSWFRENLNESSKRRAALILAVAIASHGADAPKGNAPESKMKTIHPSEIMTQNGPMSHYQGGSKFTIGKKYQGYKPNPWTDKTQTIKESIINRLKARLGDYVPKEDFERRFEGGIINHETKVHGHNVRVQFTPYKGAHKEFNVDFYVNGKTQKGQSKIDNPQHGTDIGVHVGRVVSSFIHHFKPDALDGAASDLGSIKHERAKQRLYKAGLSAIAQHHGGKIKDFPDISTSYYKEDVLSFGNLLESKEKKHKTKAVGQAQSQRSKEKKLGKSDMDVAFHMRKAGRSDEEIAAYFDMSRPKIRGQLYSAKDWNPNYTKAVNESRKLNYDRPTSLDFGHYEDKLRKSNLEAKHDWKSHLGVGPPVGSLEKANRASIIRSRNSPTQRRNSSIKRKASDEQFFASVKDRLVNKQRNKKIDVSTLTPEQTKEVGDRIVSRHITLANAARELNVNDDHLRKHLIVNHSEYKAASESGKNKGNRSSTINPPAHYPKIKMTKESIDEAINYSKDKFVNHGDSMGANYVHRAMINGHNVGIGFHEDSPEKYDVTFTVNNSTIKSNAKVHSPKDRKAIVDHVKNTVAAFKQHFNPKVIMGYSSDSNFRVRLKKASAYTRGLENLGGKVMDDGPFGRIATCRECMNEDVDYSKDSFKAETRYNDTPEYIHQAMINGHHVLVGFSGKADPDRYDAVLAVNGSINKKANGVSNQWDKHAIATHVRKVAKAFVQHFNPKQITASASDNNSDIRAAKAIAYSRGIHQLGAKKLDYPSTYGVQGTFRESIKESEDTYHGSHEAPDKEGGAPMHDVTANGIYPHDFYSHNGFHYYSYQGNSYDYETHSRISNKRNRPNAMTEVYRAVPKDVPSGTKINPGDWVTPSRGYAHDHGKSHLGGKGTYKILKKTVRANELYTDGNSIHEWGYHPTPRAPLTPEQQERRKAHYERLKGQMSDLHSRLDSAIKSTKSDK